MLFADHNTKIDCHFQKSKSLAELLAKYPDERIRGIDATKYEVPTIGEESSLEALKEAERRGRIGEGHMALRSVKIICFLGSCLVARGAFRGA